MIGSFILRIRGLRTAVFDNGVFIMEQYSHYTAALESCIRSYSHVILLIWGMLLAAIVALLFISKGEGKKGRVQTRKSILCIFLIGVVISLIVYCIYILPIKKDMQETAYEVYAGEFYVEECYGSKTHVYMTIKCDSQNKVKRYTVLCDVKEVENYTTYNGVIVYGKYSKYLLDMDLSDTDLND